MKWSYIKILYLYLYLYLYLMTCVAPTALSALNTNLLTDLFTYLLLEIQILLAFDGGLRPVSGRPVLRQKSSFSRHLYIHIHHRRFTENPPETG